MYPPIYICLCSKARRKKTVSHSTVFLIPRIILAMQEVLNMWIKELMLSKPLLNMKEGNRRVLFTLLPLYRVLLYGVSFSLCSFKNYKVSNTLPYLQPNNWFCRSSMDAGRHKTPGLNAKGFIIPGTASSMRVMSASVLHTPDCTGQHSEGQMTAMYGVEHHRRGAWTKRTHISYYEKPAHPLLEREMLSRPSKAVRNLLFLWRETLSLSS